MISEEQARSHAACKYPEAGVVSDLARSCARQHRAQHGAETATNPWCIAIPMDVTEGMFFFLPSVAIMA